MVQVTRLDSLGLEDSPTLKLMLMIAHSKQDAAYYSSNTNTLQSNVY